MLCVARPTLLLFLLAACASPDERPETPSRAPEPPPRRPPDRVLAAVTVSLASGDVAAARERLERDRWLAEDRAGAALLLAGCLLLERDHAGAVDVLRGYIAKTPAARSEGDRIVERLLRHHGGGGMGRAGSAREACYFGLYAMGALDEAATARPDLERAFREAPDAERHLARIALKGLAR